MYYLQISEYTAPVAGNIDGYMGKNQLGGKYSKLAMPSLTRTNLSIARKLKRQLGSPNF